MNRDSFLKANENNVTINLQIAGGHHQQQYQRVARWSQLQHLCSHPLSVRPSKFIQKLSFSRNRSICILCNHLSCAVRPMTEYNSRVNVLSLEKLKKRTESTIL